MSKYKIRVTTNWIGAKTEIDLIDDWGMNKDEAIDLVNRYKEGKLTKEEDDEIMYAAMEAASFEYYLTNEEDKYGW